MKYKRRGIYGKETSLENRVIRKTKEIL